MKTEDNNALVSPWWHRLIHVVFDGAIIWWLSNQVQVYLVEAFALSRDFFWLQIMFPLLFLLYLVYYFSFEYWLGWTPGKLLTKTRVWGVDGGRATALQILARTLTRFVFLDPFTFFAKRPTGWHDTFSGTRVAATSGVFALTSLTTLKRFTASLFVGFSAIAYLLMIALPVVVFHRWNDSVVLTADEQDWAQIQIDDQSVAVPGNVRSLEGSWSIPMGMLQSISIRPIVDEPADKLSSDIDTLQLHPLILVQLSEFEEKDTLLWYRYKFEGVPFVVAGYFMESERGWYQIEMQGFKVDATAVLRHMFDYSVEQSSQE